MKNIDIERIVNRAFGRYTINVRFKEGAYVRNEPNRCVIDWDFKPNVLAINSRVEGEIIEIDAKDIISIEINK